MEKQDSLLVSVIIPAYNTELFVERTLSSVRAQTYLNIEIVVIDDGSTDKTPEIIKRFADEDSRVVFLQQENSGVVEARNLGIVKSSGTFIAFIDADDTWHPKTIEKLVNCLLHSSSSVGLVYAWSAYIDEEDFFTGGYKAVLNEKSVHQELIVDNFVGNASACLIRRSCLDEAGLFDADFRDYPGCADWDFYLRIAEKYEFKAVPEFLVRYRQTTGSMSCNIRKMLTSYELLVQKQKNRNLAVSSKLYGESFAIYCLNLGAKCSQSGLHGKAVIWTSKAAWCSPKLILNSFLYKCLIASTLKFCLYPVNSLIWKDHCEWIKFKEKFKKALKLSRPKYKVDDYSFDDDVYAYFKSTQD